MAWASVVFSSVRPLFVNLGFSGTATQLQCYMESSRILCKATYPPYLQTIFSFFKICNFQFFMIFFFSLAYYPTGAKTYSHSFSPISTKLYDKYVSHGGMWAIKVLFLPWRNKGKLLFLAIGQVLIITCSS